MIIEIEKEEDGHCVAEVPNLPGVMVYGETRDEAVSKVKVLALRIIADRIEHKERLSWQDFSQPITLNTFVFDLIEN